MSAPHPATVLFVYGTLAPGEENAHIMDGMDGTWHKATVRGQRISTGWGVHKGHPGLIPNAQGAAIEGLVFISDDLPNHWQRLDVFEGEDYQRVRIPARLSNGDIIQAYVYRVITPS
ncbi:MAG TPA: gamma-glutamylcyclotransferase [Hellea balneolensis]|uniref:Gamma-glutamylcyclotransferase n=1 Tax=Hellea balneolensis TaxID=287478 RepID=A0A7C3CB09_9PROT|nr:gamma-glutamylcyclotransferase [Hellea balneolensis]